MMNVQLAAIPHADGAVCSLHPDRAAVATCARCGSFICADDRREVLDKPYCGACAALPEVDYLEATRRRYWGKRDTWTWLVGIGAIVNVVGGIGWLTMHHPLQGLAVLTSAVLGFCFFFGLRWARVGYLAGALLLSTFSWFASPNAQSVGNSAFDQGAATGRAAGWFIMVLLVVAIFFDTRNRLFFKIEVPRERLEKLWDTYRNNAIARAGFMLSLLGIVVPGLGVVTLLLCVVGLNRVEPDAHPPIGRKGQAIAGIVLSVLDLIGWGVFLTIAWMS